MSGLGSELQGELPSGCSHGDILSVGPRAGLSGVYFPWGTSLGGVFFEAVTCPTPLECLAVGIAVYNSESSDRAENLLVTTSDGGQSWQTTTFAGGDSSGSLTSVSCPNSERCLAVGTTTFQFRTSDAGMTWSVAGTRNVEFKTQQSDPSGLWCFTDSTCFVVGVRGSVTKDGGLRWQRPTGLFVYAQLLRN